MNIKVHIERLVLEGLPVERAQARHIQAAVERELTRLLTHGGVHPELAQSGAYAHAPGGRMEIAPGAKPAALGAGIAQAAYRGIGK